MNRPAIFITGAAQGIGRAAALHFARRHWFVGLFDVQVEALQAVLGEIGTDNGMAAALDVTRPEHWEPALEQFWNASGQRLDVLLNNAGIASSGPFHEQLLSRHHAIVDVNLKGVINGCHAGYEYLRGTPGSRLINLASASAIYGAADLATYSATKFAVRGLTEALDLEWRDAGIRVCDIWPLFVSTPMVDKLSLATIRSLGVRLSAQDVAAVIWKAATHRGHRVHWRVGLQTQALYRAVCLLPDALHRSVTARLSGY